MFPQIMKMRRPTFELFQDVGRALRHQDVSRVAGVHNSLGSVEATAENIEVGVNVSNAKKAVLMPVRSLIGRVFVSVAIRDGSSGEHRTPQFRHGRSAQPSLPVFNWAFLIFSAKSIRLMVTTAFSNRLNPALVEFSV